MEYIKADKIYWELPYIIPTKKEGYGQNVN